MPPRRHVVVYREVKAGCRECGGARVEWRGGPAQGLAAQHTDRTGHKTWVDIAMRLEYVRGPGGPRRARTR